MPTTDLDIFKSQEWLGLLQPVGLVVSSRAMKDLGVRIDSAKLVDLQDRLREVVSTEPLARQPEDKVAWIENFPAFTEKVLEWVPEDLVPAEDLPDKLSAVLPSYGETLRPTYGVKDPDSGEWVLLIQVLAPGMPMDEDDPAGATGWKASFQAKFERLLRETGIPTGLLVNGTELRLVYAPSGESSGYLTFPVQAMVEVPGRLILGALDLLIGADRLFNVPENQRLNRLLADSRNYQAEVSTKLASQVLDALWELLRGFQAADAAANGKLLGLTSPYGTEPTSPPSPLSTSGEGGQERSPTPPSPWNGEGGRGGEVNPIPGYIYALCRELRKEQTNAEEILWAVLRNRQFEGLKFRRQHPLGRYIADFYCAERRLVIELDGAVHDLPDQQEYDRIREDIIRTQSLTVLRFRNEAVETDLEGVLFGIYQAAVNEPTSPPSPLSTSGEGEPGHSPTPPSPFHGEGGRGGEVYGGLITTLMRLVFLLYAEEEGLIPNRTEETDEMDIYQRHYAVAGLYEKLREDASNYPDTMDQRYGAWAWLLSLFRLVYDGGGAREDYLPARRGQLFDPDIHPFLEGRPRGSHYGTYGRVDAPRVADGVIYRILDKLLTLDGERLSYRALDVEQIGSVYEAIMGYEVEVAEGLSIAVRPKDVVINVETLLAEKPANRAKVLQDWAECKLTGKGATVLKEAKTVDDLLAALGSRISSRTPNLVPPGGLYLQPGEERRRTGSHYTPRKLTQPIVETTLRPIFEQLGDHPTPEQILDLKVCDLAMGSAAFLVEACRQLAEKLVAAWDDHGLPGDVPETVEPLRYARRLVAQRCLYGVDKNPFAVNLAKLSLWLVTLSKDQPFTFVDHALKCGDSLVGLTRSEIGAFVGQTQLTLFGGKVRDRVLDVQAKRLAIQGTDSVDDAADDRKRQELREIDDILDTIRKAADLSIAAFFDGKSAKDRNRLAEDYKALLAQGTNDYLTQISDQLRHREHPITPFNWEIEFPEVFDRKNPGFDAIVGNPPFAGKNTIINGNPEGYVDWLKIVHPESHGNADLVAHFFRRAFTITRQGGAFGLIATNTIAQGDTRSTGLRYICNHGGMIYNATRRYRWPGVAAVVVSLVHIWKQFNPLEDAR